MFREGRPPVLSAMYSGLGSCAALPARKRGTSAISAEVQSWDLATPRINARPGAAWDHHSHEQSLGFCVFGVELHHFWCSPACCSEALQLPRSKDWLAVPLRLIAFARCLELQSRHCWRCMNTCLFLLLFLWRPLRLVLLLLASAAAADRHLSRQLVFLC